MGPFSDSGLAGLDESGLDDYESLMEAPEPLLYAMLTGKATPPPAYDHAVLRLIRRLPRKCPAARDLSPRCDNSGPAGRDGSVCPRAPRRLLLARPGAPAAAAHPACRARRRQRWPALAAALRFFAPGLEVLRFPAWDCLPYDRVSPHRDLVARRIDGLTRLARWQGKGGPLVVTTVNALLQRLPPRACALRRALLVAVVGGDLPDARSHGAPSCWRNGYRRAATP